MTFHENEFSPDYPLHAGIFLEEELESISMSQAELAKRSGLTPKTINSIIKGSASISSETAVILSSVLGKSANYWINLETHFQISKANLENDAQLKEEVSDLLGTPVTPSIGFESKGIKITPYTVLGVLCKKFFNDCEE